MLKKLLSNDFKKIIWEEIDKVEQVIPNVKFEEHILVPSLNNYIILRFRNIDLELLSIDELSKRENEIREILSPNFFCNFIGDDYKHFGLNLRKLRDILIRCDLNLEMIHLSAKPFYYDLVQSDLNQIKHDFNLNLVDIWEIQFDYDEHNILYFERDYNLSIEFPSNFIAVKNDSSFRGIKKVLLHAEKEGVSMFDVMKKYGKLT